MSLVLRHKPEVIGLKLDERGYLSIEDFLFAAEKNGRKLTYEDLKFVVDNDNKKRYSISNDGLKIRANQGHSVSVDVELVPRIPEQGYLYHGTQRRNIESIMSSGINKGNRLHVHLSDNLETAKKVGVRRGSDFVILYIDCKKMVADGHTFYLSENNVWLVDFIPSEYISEKED